MAHEVYGDEIAGVPMSNLGQTNVSSEYGIENEYNGHNGTGGHHESIGDRLSDSTCDVTRVRLVQFQRNTDEPLVIELALCFPL